MAFEIRPIQRGSMSGHINPGMYTFGSTFPFAEVLLCRWNEGRNSFAAWKRFTYHLIFRCHVCVKELFQKYCNSRYSSQMSLGTPEIGSKSRNLDTTLNSMRWRNHYWPLTGSESSNGFHDRDILITDRVGTWRIALETKHCPLSADIQQLKGR